MTHGPRQKSLDFGGNPDHVRIRVRVRWGHHCTHLFDGDNSAKSAALGKVCTLLIAILVYYYYYY